MDCTLVTDILTKNIFKYVSDKKVVLGISGGIDSALTYKLLELAIGQDNIIPITMPYKNQSTDNAFILANKLDFSLTKIHIEDVAHQFYDTVFGLDLSKQTTGNIMSRTRMVILYAYANHYNGLVAGTSNQTEIELGYYTKYGDGGVDFEAIGSLYKTEVWELAKYLKLPKEIIEAKPTAGLWEGQTDEDELGLTYEEIDKYLINGVEQDMSKKEKIDNIRHNSSHKRFMPPTILRV